MDISVPQAWKEIRNAFKRMQTFFFTYDVLDETLLRRHKIMMSCLFVFWLVFIMPFCKWNYETILLESIGALIPIWVGIILLLIKQVFLNFFFVRMLVLVPYQISKFNKAKKCHDKFKAGRIELTKLIVNNTYAPMLSTARRRKFARCLARFIRLHIFVTRFQVKFHGFKKSNMEYSFDLLNLAANLNIYIPASKYHYFIDCYNFLHSDSNPQFLNFHYLFVQEVESSIVKTHGILNGTSNDNIYDNIGHLENIIFNLLLDYRSNENN